MIINHGRFTSTLLLLIGLMLTVSIANGQTNSGASEQETVATVTNSPARNNTAATMPVFTDYRGISIGMSAENVRSTLNNLKKDKALDVFVFSEKESAQIYYDDQGKVTAISIDYFGEDNNAPSPAAVIGAELQAKADGSMYDLKRYPEAGYWVSYNRTAGDKPIVTITMQKMQKM